MTSPIFGININRVDSEPRPAIGSDMSIVGIVGTAPAASADVFPLNTPVFMFSDDTVKLTALGTTGTLRDAVDGVNAQLGDFQASANIVIVRVAEGASTGDTLLNLAGDSAARTGIHALLRSGPVTGFIPRLICVPGFTSQRGGGAANIVCAGLPAVLSKLLAHAVVDGPATTLQDYIDWRETLASSRLIPVEFAVKVAGVAKPASPRVIGIGVRRDHEKGGKPFHSWANQPVYGITAPGRDIEFSLTDGATEGQAILTANGGILVRGEMGVEAAISSAGFVYIGTDNAGDDTIWQFYNQTRGRDYIHLLFLKTLRFYLGKFNLDGPTIEAVFRTMDLAMRDLKADNHILGYKIGFNRDQNSPEELRLGKFTLSFAAEEPAPLRYIGIQSARYRPALDTLLADVMAQLDVAA